MPGIETPYKPNVIEEKSDTTIVECARCASYIPCGVREWVGLRTDDGEMVTEVTDSNHLGAGSGPPFPYETEQCSVCNGSARIQVPYTDSVPTCIRCLGRGWVVEDKVSRTREKIQELEKEHEREKKKKLENADGLIDYLWKSITVQSFGEKKKKARELKEQIPDGPDARVLEFSTCSSCGGSGVGDNDRTDGGSFLAECQRCVGTGRMATECANSYTSAIMELSSSCFACYGEGTVTVNEDPPFVTCTNCDGYGEVHDGKTTALGVPTDIITCPICGGYGFSTTEDIRTVE